MFFFYYVSETDIGHKPAALMIDDHLSLSRSLKIADEVVG